MCYGTDVSLPQLPRVVGSKQRVLGASRLDRSPCHALSLTLRRLKPWQDRAQAPPRTRYRALRESGKLRY